MDDSNGQQLEPQMDADERRYERQGQIWETPNA
jgi:hypothetical protein